MQSDDTTNDDIFTRLSQRGVLTRFRNDMQRLGMIAIGGDSAFLAAERTSILMWVTAPTRIQEPEVMRLVMAVTPPPDPRHLVAPIAKRLVEERERVGLSIEQLAYIGGTTVSEQNHFEAGVDVGPPASYIAKIAGDTGIDLLYVMTGRRDAGLRRG